MSATKLIISTGDEEVDSSPTVGMIALYDLCILFYLNVFNLFLNFNISKPAPLEKNTKCSITTKHNSVFTDLPMSIWSGV